MIYCCCLTLADRSIVRMAVKATYFDRPEGFWSLPRYAAVKSNAKTLATDL